LSSIDLRLLARIPSILKFAQVRYRGQREFQRRAMQEAAGQRRVAGTASEWAASTGLDRAGGSNNWPSPEANSHSAIIAAAMPKNVDVEGKGRAFSSLS
jgi:hypothetical protein